MSENDDLEQEVNDAPVVATTPLMAFVNSVKRYVTGGGSLDAVLMGALGLFMLYAWPVLQQMGSDEIAMTSMIGKAMPLVLALFAYRIVLFGMDKLIGADFGDDWSQLEPFERNQYYCARMIAVAFVVGMVVG